jgi:glyoxylase-like metal-dependent hydrolase (beta-lactamase superfamily II)
VRVGAHTAGSQAVYVTTLNGTAILTGDVCFVYDNIEKNIPTGIFFRYDESISAMQRFRNQGKYVIVSHDPRVLQRHATVPPRRHNF